MSHAVQVLQRLGFAPTTLAFTLRTAVAACCAVVLAWVFGLEHPQWSGMTVWAASQPMRGHLLEKSLFRLVGTVVGSLFGIVLLLAAQGQMTVVVVGLSVWVGLCAGGAVLIRGFASYGVMLSGYSAAMVSLLHSPVGGGELAVGIDRMLTALLGVLVALAFGWLFAKDRDSGHLAREVDRLSVQALEALARFFQGAPAQTHTLHLPLLMQTARLDESLDGYAAGSLQARQWVLVIRQLLSAEVAAVLWMQRQRMLADAGPSSATLAAALQEAADALRGPARDRLEKACRVLQHCAAADRAQRQVLRGLARALRAYGRLGAGVVGDVFAGVPLALHRDWVGAREAALRAGGSTMAAGVLWLASGWSAGAFMMLGTTIMTTVFATADNPVKTLRVVAVGQVIGVIGALACRWLVWPLANDEAGLVLGMLPFILLGAFIAAHRRSAVIGYDYNMVMLLLLQPLWPLQGDLPASLATASAVVLGPLTALCAYRVIFPVSAARRLMTLRSTMAQGVEAMAMQSGAARLGRRWRSRLYHRLLQLVQCSEKAGHDGQEILDGCAALLLMTEVVLYTDTLQRRPDLPARIARRLRVARLRLGRIGTDPARAARALERAAAALASLPGAKQALLHEAAKVLDAQQAFFRQESRTA